MAEEVSIVVGPACLFIEIILVIWMVVGTWCDRRQERLDRLADILSGREDRQFHSIANEVFAKELFIQAQKNNTFRALRWSRK